MLGTLVKTRVAIYECFKEACRYFWEIKDFVLIVGSNTLKRISWTISSNVGVMAKGVS